MPGQGWKKFKGLLDQNLGNIPPYAKKVSILITVTPNSIGAEAYAPGALQPYVTVTESGRKGQDHSVVDRRMGAPVYNPKYPCNVCQLPKCVGHLGYIPLPKVCIPTYNDAIKHNIKKINEICYNCRGVKDKCVANHKANLRG